MASNTAAPTTSTPAAASAGTPSRRRAQTGSGFVRMPGRRPMKEFPLTKTELYGLASIGGFATLCFSGGSAALSYASTVTKDIAFSSNVSEKVISYYSGLRDVAFYGSFGLFFVGIVALAAGGLLARSIINETKHD
jgi:hypothetical protein